MLPLDSPRWQKLNHVYGSAGDIPEKLRRLEAAALIEWAPKSAMEEITSAIYHQGDPSTASYATIPHLIRIAQGRKPAEQIWLVLLCGWVEGARTSSSPNVPDDLSEAYAKSLVVARRLAIDLLSDPLGSWRQGAYSSSLTNLFGAIAAFDGERGLARDLAVFDLMKDCYETTMKEDS